MFEHSEAFIISSISWLRLIIESIGALVIAFGILVAVIGFIRMLGSKQSDGFTRVRINFAHYLALGLEFQLGADILSTAVAPTWEQIGKLAAIAVIRTGLNFFLMREMNETQEHPPVSTTKPSQRTA